MNGGGGDVAKLQLRERLAGAQHAIWARWMIWQFKQGQHNADGTWTMPAAKVERWTRQMNTPYSELPDHERHSDREIADELITIVNDAIKEWVSGE